MRRATVRTTGAMGLMTLAEKGLALGRHMLLAALLGAGAAMDTLVVGVSVAELVVALLTGSFLVVFIPLYARWREADGTAAADGRALNLMLLLLLVLAAAAALLAMWGGTLAAWAGYGFSAAQQAEAAALMPWLGIFLWATGGGVLATGLYHVRGRFLAPQAARMAERVVVLAALAWLAPRLGIRGVAAAMALGALAQLAVLAGRAAARRGVPRAAVDPAAPEVRSYLALFLPLLAAAVIDQAVLFTDRAMASTLPPGAVSALYYASLLWGIPVILLSTNFCTVLFPRLADDVAAGAGPALQRSLSFGLKSMVLVMGGATALMLVLSQDLTALLLERGRFDPAATLLTGHALAALALCLIFQGVGNVINIALYAAGRTGVVAACGVGRVLLNLVFNALLMGPLGAVGIALSTSLTLGLWTLLIARPFRREMGRRGVGRLWDRSFQALAVKTAVAAAACALAAGAVAASPPLAGEALLSRLLRLAAAGVAGLAAYGGLLWALRLPEAAAALRLVVARLGFRGAV